MYKGEVVVWLFYGVMRGGQVTEINRNFIDFEVENRQIGRWRYTRFYGFPEREKRRDSWEMLRCLDDKSNLPWCIFEDFNDMMCVDEKRGVRPQPRCLLEGFATTVNECGLADLGFVGEKFTWEKLRGQHNWIQERLDRCLANQTWQQMFPEVEVQVIEVATSDHLPLYLNLNKQVYAPRQKYFRFENIWLREQDCRNVVRNGWDLGPDLDIMGKIKLCGIKLEEWGGEGD